MGAKNKCLYLIVTQDKYELPLFVGTIKEVAEKAGVSENAIYSSISHFERGRLATCKYRKVYLDGYMGRKSKNGRSVAAG